MPDWIIARLGVAVDESDESVLWLTAMIQSGIRDDLETKNLAGEGREIRAILSKSHKTARENRRRKARAKRASITNSPIP